MSEDRALAMLERWIEAYQPVVYRAAWLILRDRDAAEDVAQETFLRAWRAADRVYDEDGVKAWLYRIAVNTALNVVRKKKREREAMSRMESPGPVPDRADARATASVVAGAIDRLPDRLRIAVICRYFLDLSELQIAQTLRVRPGTVKSRLFEARKMLAGDEELALAAGPGGPGE